MPTHLQSKLGHDLVVVAHLLPRGPEVRHLHLYHEVSGSDLEVLERVVLLEAVLLGLACKRNNGK
jgi:hypothetical protein